MAGVDFLSLLSSPSADNIFSATIVGESGEAGKYIAKRTGTDTDTIVFGSTAFEREKIVGMVVVVASLPSGNFIISDANMSDINRETIYISG